MPAVILTIQGTPSVPIFLCLILNNQLVNKVSPLIMPKVETSAQTILMHTPPLPTETAEKTHWWQREAGANPDPARSIKYL